MDRVSYDLPIDFLSFCRFFAYEHLVHVVAKAKDKTQISYNSAYYIFKRMGLIPFDMDVGIWIKDLLQGMNSMKPIGDPLNNEELNLRMINGY